jgi:peptidoglycan/LPS O-acetylase OafA/YrhL
MARLLFVKEVNITTFFVKRASRIIPTLWLFITVMVVYSAYFQSSHYVIGTQELIGSYLFLGSYYPSDISIWASNWPNAHLWSLNVEEHSYIYLAIGAICIRKSKNPLALKLFFGASFAIIATLIVLYMRAYIADGLVPWRIKSQCASLGIVTAAAVCAIRYQGRIDWPFAHRFLNPVLLLAAALFCFTRYMPAGWNASILLAPIAAAIAVNYSERFPDLVKRIFCLGVFRWFGKCSFSIYLWQQPFHIIQTGNFYNSLSLFAMAMVVGTVSFYFFENPVRDYLNGKWDAYQQSASASAASALISR